MYKITIQIQPGEQDKRVVNKCKRTVGNKKYKDSNVLSSYKLPVQTNHVAHELVEFGDKSYEFY